MLYAANEEELLAEVYLEKQMLLMIQNIGGIFVVDVVTTGISIAVIESIVAIVAIQELAVASVKV